MLIKEPDFYTWGFNDETGPPISIYVAYNSMGAAKELTIYKETGHHTVEAQREQSTNWLISKLKTP